MQFVLVGLLVGNKEENLFPLSKMCFQYQTYKDIFHCSNSFAWESCNLDCRMMKHLSTFCNAVSDFWLRFFKEVFVVWIPSGWSRYKNGFLISWVCFLTSRFYIMGNIPFSAFCCFRGALNFPEGVGTGPQRAAATEVLTSDKMAVSTFVHMFIAE